MKPINRQIKDMKGMRDIFELYPYFYHVRRCSEKVVQNKYGYSHIIPNILERQSTYIHSLGSLSEIVQKEMYSFTDKGGNDVVLRPEGTAGAMRFVVNNKSLIQNIEKEAVKMWYMGPMYRYERPQAGRMRQFYQLGVENIGGSSTQKNDIGHQIQNDVEILNSAVDMLNLVFEHKLKFKVHINNLGSKSTISEYNTALKSVLDKYEKHFSEDSQRRLSQNRSLRILESKDKND